MKQQESSTRRSVIHQNEFQEYTEEGHDRRDVRWESRIKKFGDASLHPRMFSCKLAIEEYYLFFLALAFAFGFAFAFALGFAFAFGFAFFAAAIFILLSIILSSRQPKAGGARAQSQCIVTLDNLVKKKVKQDRKMRTKKFSSRVSHIASSNFDIMPGNFSLSKKFGARAFFRASE